mgnify:CR=1 FL=1
MTTYDVPTVDALAPLLRGLRKARGWTQADLARQMDVTVARISAIERAPGRVRADQLFALLHLLGGRMQLELPDAGRRVAEPREEW